MKYLSCPIFSSVHKNIIDEMIISIFYNKLKKIYRMERRDDL